MLVISSSFWLHDIWHPLSGNGYQFWSGIGSDISELSLVVAMISGFAWVKRHYQCHAEGCKKPGLHVVQGTPHRTCWAHHPTLNQTPRHSVPLLHIHNEHQQSLENAVKIKEGDG